MSYLLEWGNFSKGVEYPSEWMRQTEAVWFGGCCVRWFVHVQAALAGWAASLKDALASALVAG